MSNQDAQLLSSENVQTVIAVCFVLSLLAVAFNFYNFTSVNRAEAIAVQAASIDVQSLHDALADSRRQIAQLREQVATLEAEVASMKAQASAAPVPAP